MAIRRVELMTEFCGRRCLPPWHELIEEEAFRVATGRALKREEYAWRDNGRWFPQMTAVGPDITSIMRRELVLMVARIGVPLAQRSIMLRRLMRNGRLTQEAVNILEPGREVFLAAMREKYPFPESVFRDDLFFRNAKGEVSDQAVADALEEALGDLPFFVGWAYDRHDPKRQLTQWLRTSDWVTLISKLRAEFGALIERGRALGIPEKEFNKLVRRLRSKLLGTRERILLSKFDDLRDRLRAEGIDERSWKSRVVGSEVGTLPSLDAPLEIAIEYFVRNIAPGASARNALTSDYGDMLHMAYLPHVDVFRCDGYAAELARKPASRYGTTVVSSLRQLPDAIEALKSAPSPGD